MPGARARPDTVVACHGHMVSCCVACSWCVVCVSAHKVCVPVPIFKNTPRETHPNQKAQTPRGARPRAVLLFRIFVSQSVVCAARCAHPPCASPCAPCARLRVGWVWGCAPAQGAGTGVRLAARGRHQLSLRLSRWPPHITQTHVSIIPWGSAGCGSISARAGCGRHEETHGFESTIHTTSGIPPKRAHGVILM